MKITIVSCIHQRRVTKSVRNIDICFTLNKQIHNLIETLVKKKFFFTDIQNLQIFYITVPCTEYYWRIPKFIRYVNIGPMD